MTPTAPLALCLPLLAAALVAACGDVPVIEPEETGAAIEPLVTITVPEHPGASWTLPGEAVRVHPFKDRHVLFFDKGAERLEASIPVPKAAEGAGHVSLRVMSDGAFTMNVVVGGKSATAADRGETRRRWREMMFSLPVPLTDVQEGERITIVRESGELPTVVEAIRFFP